MAETERLYNQRAFVQRLKEITLGLPGKKIAEMIGEKPGTVSKWKSEKYSTVPTTEQLMKISKEFNCSIDYLLDINTTTRQLVEDEREDEIMARGDITIRQEVRPCKVFYWRKSAMAPGEEELVEVNGLWHMWRDDGREGIVELEDGHIVYIEPKYVRFLDSDRLFEEYDWEETDEET